MKAHISNNDFTSDFIERSSIMLPDIQSRLKSDFDPDGFMEVLSVINLWEAQTKGLLDDRLLRAVIFLSRGNLEEFVRLKDAARHEWKDLIEQAENDKGVRIRDFARTFGQETLR